MVTIALLSKENFNPHSLDAYERKHDVKKVYRKKEAEYILMDMPYVEDWSLAEKRQIAMAVSSDAYISYIALDNGTVVGFLGLKRRLHNGYMILDMLYVSAAYRGMGIGRRLFAAGKEAAKKAGAAALYISACSSEETIAFYRAMGAELTDCPIQEMADDEPCDLQMVCIIDEKDEK